MAKLKQAIKKMEYIVARNIVIERELAELTNFLAIMVDRLGGKVEFSLDDAKPLAGKKFDVTVNEGVFTISLT